MSENSLRRSPQAATTRSSLCLVGAVHGVGQQPGALQERNRAGHPLIEGQLAHVFAGQPVEFVRVEAGRRVVDTLQAEVGDHHVQRDELALVVQRPAEPAQVVDQRRRQVTQLPIKGHRGRVEVIPAIDFLLGPADGVQLGAGPPG